jgi:hypothetical protein
MASYETRIRLWKYLSKHVTPLAAYFRLHGGYDSRPNDKETDLKAWRVETMKPFALLCSCWRASGMAGKDLELDRPRIDSKSSPPRCTVAHTV